ncbi:hypothetical protein [Bergeyella sp. RCAD1439]|uniref:hypothetical protein n=1 Tax=Bergeyella anatis TaxID=3113737 RepID=UPI002E198C13|nr:hypothetical protein [Bergeyella sp. RCAD1439]
MPQSFGIYEHIIKNLRHLDYEVVDISMDADRDFKYPNIGYKIYNFLRKVFLDDKDYKKKLKQNKVGKYILPTLEKLIDKADYALIIRPDIYPRSTIKAIKRKTHFMVGYQWDGLKRFPMVKLYVKYFDRFFVFDKEDLDGGKYSLLTNFYFDYPILKERIEIIPNSVYFVGNYFENRKSILEKIGEKVSKQGMNSRITVLLSPPNYDKEGSSSYVNYVKGEISFEENIKRVLESEILVDIVNTVHKGLSFRVFEALGNDKKLITNNTTIKEYDFYNPNNIFVIENENLEGLEAFLKTDYIIDEKIKEKYAFSNWIKRVLE